MQRHFSATIALVLLSFSASAQDRLLTIDDLFDPAKRINFNGSPVAVAGWTRDGSHYLQSKVDPQTRLAQLLKVNAATGDAAPFYDASKMEAAFATQPGIDADAARQIAHRRFYQMNPLQTAALINHANDLFYYEFGSDKALRLTNTPEEEVGEGFSPDGRMVSFVRRNDLYMVEVTSGRERALTSDGSAKIFNGRLNWVYQEELYGRGNFGAYWWSPDSTRIAFLRLDDTPVSEFTIVDHIPHFQETEVTPYPKAGDANPTVKLGVARAAGGDVRWVDTFKYHGGEFLIVRVGWTPDAKRIVYQLQDREQTWLDLNLADPATGKTYTLFRETTPAWVEADAEPRWLKDGSFLWMSERSGWKHIYHYSTEGNLIRQITTGKWEARSLEGVDEAGGWIYFTASEHSPTANHVYRIRLDGSAMTRLTQMEGNHSTNFNPQLSLFVDIWSDINTPPQSRLYKSDGSLIRVIEENRVDALKQFKLGKAEFLQVKTRDGFVMEAMMIKPPGFDPAKKYPVMSYTYSGPHAPQVRNSWGGPRLMWHHMLAQKGYIIWICDNRTASGKGAESTWPVYKNFGELELRDLEDGLAWLKSQPFVDGARIGLWGWSYGGFMTSYSLTHSKSFKMGIAGGSVTDWRLYDTIYTERYMRMPQNNVEGYRKSPLASASELSGKLLLIHGMIDDNVHMQNTIQFAYELQKAGKPFQLMLYPKSRHGVTDPLLVKHMYSTMTEFIEKNL